jgi:5'-nucleotidase
MTLYLRLAHAPKFVCSLSISLLMVGCGATESEGVASKISAVTVASEGDAEHEHAHGCGDHSDAPEAGDAREVASHRVHWEDKGRNKKETTQEVKIFGFNDFHGQLSPRTVSSRPAGGAAVFAAYLKAGMAASPSGALVIHAGDHVGASPPSSALLQDEPAISVMNALANKYCRYEEVSGDDCRKSKHRDYGERDDDKCNIVGTLGNHEFDEGKDELLRLVYGGNFASGPFLESPYKGARFGYISSNVVDEDTGKTLFPAYTIRKVGKVRVGMIGAVLKETPTIVTPSGVEGLKFLDEAESINKYVKVLKKKGVRTIGVTIHQGGNQPSFTGPTPEGGTVNGVIASIVNKLDDEVDFIISGHTHSFTNALIPNANGKQILVTQAFSASTAYDDVTLTVSLKTGDVVAKTASIVTTWGDEGPGLTPDADALAIVKAADDATKDRVNQIVANASTSITRVETSAGESALGNLIADAQRAATGSQIACMNPGGIRADLAAGEVTWGELFTIQPFGNSLVAMDLTGQQVVDLLNQQWIGQTSQRILKCSGITYTWDSTIPVGTNRIVDAMVGGVALDLAATYRITVNSFMASGGDNFTVLVAGTNRVGGDVDLDALIAYVKTLPQPFTAAIENRITMR